MIEKVVAGAHHELCHTSLCHTSLNGLKATSASAAIVYNLLVNGDPLAQYQVDEVGDSAKLMPKNTLSPSSSYVVFVKRGNTARRMLHNSIGLVAVGMCARRSPELMEATIYHARCSG